MIQKAAETPIGRVVATEAKPATPHQFHFWTATDTSIGIGAIVKVLGSAVGAQVSGRVPNPVSRRDALKQLSAADVAR